MVSALAEKPSSGSRAASMHVDRCFRKCRRRDLICITLDRITPCPDYDDSVHPRGDICGNWPKSNEVTLRGISGPFNPWFSASHGPTQPAPAGIWKWRSIRLNSCLSFSLVFWRSWALLMLSPFTLILSVRRITSKRLGFALA